MEWEIFLDLYDLMNEDLKFLMKFDEDYNKVVNDRVHPEVVLACTLRKFVGGSLYDFATTFEVSVTVVNYSMNWVIDAVDRCKQLDIQFPEEHSEQKKITEESKNKSTAGVSNCVGDLNGLLIWIEKQREEQCTRVGVGSKKNIVFFNRL